MSLNKLALAALFSVLAIPFAYGEGWAIKGNVPFQFTAGKVSLPAGDYEMIPDSDRGLVRIENAKGNVDMLQVITRLAAETHAGSADAHAVFDKVGNTYTLSEIWLPNEDGYLVHVTKGKHEHHVLHLPHHKK